MITQQRFGWGKKNGNQDIALLTPATHSCDRADARSRSRQTGCGARHPAWLLRQVTSLAGMLFQLGNNFFERFTVG